MQNDILKYNYFKNLDGLRFLAAAVVIIHHLELYKGVFKLENFYDDGGFVLVVGKLGVVLFFALSGFLIFSILLKEKEKTGNSQVKLFYFRRILRIWPLYFFILILGLTVFQLSFFEFPRHYAESRFLGPILYSFMLPNLAACFYILIPFVGQVWSLGVEEQLYFIAPLLVKYSKRVLYFLAAIILVTVLLKAFFYLGRDSDEQWKRYLHYFNNFSYSCIAFGAFFAYLFFERKSRLFKILFHPVAQILIWGFTVISIGMGMFFSVYQFEIYALLFSMLIVNLACNEKNIVSLQNPVLIYLGKISYGLYMYHPIVIFLVLKLMLRYNCFSSPLYYILSFGLTILAAGISYRYLENPFLKIRNRIQIYK